MYDLSGTFPRGRQVYKDCVLSLLPRDVSGTLC